MIIGPLQLWTAKLPKVQYQLDTFLTVIYMYTTSILDLIGSSPKARKVMD